MALPAPGSVHSTHVVSQVPVTRLNFPTPHEMHRPELVPPTTVVVGVATAAAVVVVVLLLLRVCLMPMRMAVPHPTRNFPGKQPEHSRQAGEPGTSAYRPVGQGRQVWF